MAVSFIISLVQQFSASKVLGYFKGRTKRTSREPLKSRVMTISQSPGDSQSSAGAELRERWTSPALDQSLEPAPEHALAVEREGLRVHHLRQAWVFHHFRVDTIAMCARFEHDPREDHRLAGFQLDALRERRVLAGLHIVGHALAEFNGAMLAPDFSRLLSHAGIGLQVFLRYR